MVKQAHTQGHSHISICLVINQPHLYLTHIPPHTHTQAQIPTHTQHTHIYTHRHNHIHTHSETLQPPARNLLELSSLEIEGQGIGPPHPQLAEKMKRAMAVLFGTDA